MKLMKFAILSFIFILVSCTDKEIELKYIAQEEQIENYITSKFDTLTPITRNNGSNRITIAQSKEVLDTVTGVIPTVNVLERGDSIKFSYAGYIFNGGPQTLFYTNNPEISKFYGDTIPKSLHYGFDDLIIGLECGLEGIKDGEEAIIVFSGKYGYQNEPMYSVPAASPLLFHIWVRDIKKNK